MEQHDLLIRIDERLKDVQEHTKSLRSDVDELKTWKSKWGGASVALGGTGTVLGLVFGATKVYAYMVGG